MKIAFIEFFDPIPINSGGNWYSFQLLNKLGENNQVTQYFTNFEDREKGYCPSKIKFNREFLESKIQWDRISKKLYLIRPEILWNKTAIRNIKADVVFTIAECYHIGKYISSINNNAPIVLLMHNIEWEYLKNIHSLFYFPMKIYEEYILKNVEAIVTISPRDYKYAIKYATVEKVFYIPPHVDQEIFNLDGPKYNYGTDKFNLLFYGSLDRETNIEALKFIKYELIPILKIMRLTKIIRINIVGSGNPPNFILDKDENINLIGCVEDVGEYIRGADAVIVPVRNSSGVKIRLLESLACGKLVIANPEAVAGLPEELKENIIIKESAAEFAEMIKSTIEGKIKKTNNNIIRNSKGRGIDEVIHYVQR